MDVEISIRKTKTIVLDNSKLLTYAKEVRERFDIEADAAVNMIDILYQANLDGDVSLPVDFEFEDYDEDLTDDDLEYLAINGK